MPKRKAKDLRTIEEPRRSSRRISTKSDDVAPEPSIKVPAKKAKKDSKKITKAPEEVESGVTGKIEEESDLKLTKPAKQSKSTNATTKARPAEEDGPTGRQYWLLKAEPESRIEKGKDIKFSIDDLAAKTEPEPWDGIRNFAARNNLRAMKKGDLAFFYHSSCKVPAIVGTMAIVQEHTPDLSAHDPSAPYYDESSKPTDPKWSVVHVTFKQKLRTPITLKELKEWQAEKGHPLENMQMLRMTRMSVSKVSEGEWRFLLGEMEKRGDVVEE
ncbi:PUA-like domain-containing protein [Cadophora sp. MPI-SDFR-AT-0126]|nr:PUA-like domain-containing protein [Leotiomycetes sp. MPI-SDFR-AT-0126]